MICLEQFTSGLRESGVYRGLPICGLMDNDGDRYLLADLPIPEGVWHRAVAAGARGLMLEDHIASLDEVELYPRGDGLILAGFGSLVPAQRSSRPFVHLHAHSHYSALDGYATIQEMLDAVDDEAMAVTDHGVCAGHLELQKLAKIKGIKPIFGIEANFVDDARIKDAETRYDYWHFILLAKTEQGLINLWRASTMAHATDRFYGRPRMDWAVLQECHEGLIASTACLRGPMSRLILDDDEDGAKRMASRVQAIFGDDMYFELGTNHLHKMERDKRTGQDRLVSQTRLNTGLVSLSQQMSIPLIVVGDAHYACSDDKDAHKIWLKAQTNSELRDDDELFSGDEDYHLHSGDEAYAAIEYLGADVAAAAVARTVEVARQCDVTIRPRTATPIYHRHHIAGSDKQGIDLDNEKMRKVCEEEWTSRLLPEHQNDPVYRARFEEEIESLVSKKFCGYMLIVWDYCNHARSKNILMGPGRGSAAGSLVCDLLGITHVDPIEAGLLFERFISPGRTELPDVDSDFPASKRFDMINYLVERWGPEHTVRVGTVTRLRNAGAFRQVASVLKGSEFDVPFIVVDQVSKMIKRAESGTAGFGLSWDELMDAIGEELEPIKEQFPVWFEFSEKVVDRIKSYGKHPAGVVIDPMNSIVDWLPLRQGEEDYPVTEFPMDQIAELGLVKFDILTVRTLDTIQEVMDLLEADPRFKGKVPHPHRWRDEYDDPLMWDMLDNGETLGVFQVETPDGTRMTKDFKPRSLADMSAIGALVRPGPKRSGITAAYLRRRAGQEEVVYAHPLLVSALGETYGLMIYQENVMKTTQVIAGYTSAEADEVRSILGKKKVDKIVAEGERFRARSASMGIDPQLAARMFEQMAEFAKYAFNKSHSWSYAMVSVWTAWFKANFPAHFLVALLSTADKDRFPEYVAEARNRGYRIDLPDVNESAETFIVSNDNLGVRYGLSSIKKLGPVAAASIRAGQPYTSFDDFLERRGEKCNWGHIKLLAEVGALDSLIPEGHTRVDLQAVVDQMATGKIEQCAHMWPDTNPSMGREVCCNFDWSSEPVKLGVSGKPLKGKPLPKSCSKACRQYKPVSSVHWPYLDPLTPKEQRRHEREAFGLYITSTPFDGLHLEGTGPASFADLQADATYPVVAEVQAIKEREDRFQRRMAYVTLMMRDGTIEATCFNSDWIDLKPHVHRDSFGIFVVKKNSRGFTVNKFVPLSQE